MKNAFRLLSIAALAGCTLLGISSCSDDYDDSGLKDRLDKVEDRVTELEEWCATVNSEISSLKGLIAALEGNDYVTGVETLEDGYKITFSKSGSIIIRNGKDGIDGEDGYTPIIGVAKYSDGLYYWTIQTEDGKTNWLTDAEGNMIRTTGDNGKDGEDGEDGNDGLTPHIGENGNWWIGTTDTGVKAQGDTGADGQTPHIGNNGNWWIGTTDTGVKAQGETGNNGNNAPTPIIKTGAELGNGYTADAVYLSVDGGNEWFKISGAKGDQGIQGPVGPAGPSGAACGISDIKIEDNKVTFTLGTGSTAEMFTVPFCTPILTIAGQDKITEDNNTFTITSDIFNRNNLIIQTRVESSTADGNDITTRLISDRWNVENSVSDNTLTVKVTPPSATPLNEAALLKITVTSETGELLASGQKVFTNGIFKGTLSVSSFDDLASQLTGLDKEKVTDIKIIGDVEEVATEELFLRMQTLLSETFIGGFKQLNILEFSVPHITCLPGDSFYEKANPKVFKSDYIKNIHIDGGAFWRSGIEEVYLPNLQSLNQMDFSGCSSLRKVVLTNVKNVTGSQVFNDCIKLEMLDLPNLIDFESINLSNFARDCFQLREVNMPKVTLLPNSAFQNCYSLTNLSFPEVEELGGDIFLNCTNLLAIALPKVTILPGRAFKGCVSLSAETGFGEVQEIGESAFEGCSAITWAAMWKVTKIGKKAFAGCKKLNALSLGAVTEVGENAFDGVDTESCTVTFKGTPTDGSLDKPNKMWAGKKWKIINVLPAT